MDLFSVAADNGALDLQICFFGGNLGSRDPESIAKKIADFSFFVFQRNSTTQIVYLTSAEKILGGTLYSDLWFGGTHLLVLCSGLLLIQWFFPGISAEQLFSAELNITKCAPEFC